MKLSGKQVNLLKADIEGGSLEKLYNRLKWDNPKSIKLSMEEKDTLELMFREGCLNIEVLTVLKKHMPDRFN